jgi:hypothetical protein
VELQQVFVKGIRIGFQQLIYGMAEHVHTSDVVELVQLGLLLFLTVCFRLVCKQSRQVQFGLLKLPARLVVLEYLSAVVFVKGLMI